MKIEFECIWKKNESPERINAISLWDRFNTFPSEEVTIERSKEIVFVATRNKEVIAISTARALQVKLFNNNWFYEVRVFISPQANLPTLIVPLVLNTKKFFQNIHRTDNDHFIGIVAVIEQEKMNRNWRRAVWPVLDMYFAGYTAAGYQLRVSYFDHAKIL